MHEETLRAHGYHRVRVKRVVAETADTRTLVLEAPFSYKPGQFCTFRVRIGGEEALRSYSMSSAPETDADLAITVKRVPGGLVSNWFVDTVEPGDLLECTRPAGVFCPTDRAAPVMAFCGGSGITPIMSITKSVLASTDRLVRILYANRDRESAIFRDLLGDLSSAHTDRLSVDHHIDSDSGLLGADRIERFARAAPESDFYICGPRPFMDLVESTLARLGTEPGQVFVERFTADDARCLGGDREPAGAGATASVTIVLRGRPTTVAYQAGDTVLETARRAGLKPPFSCEAGNCATCMAFLHDGTVTMRANNVLSPEEIEEGWILTCQSLPTSPALKLEYESA